MDPEMRGFGKHWLKWDHKWSKGNLWATSAFDEAWMSRRIFLMQDGGTHQCGDTSKEDASDP
jgi:hypothetical protein